MTFGKKSFWAVLALAGAMMLGTVDMADARKGGSLGSRGTRTYAAPPTTPTAPNSAAPIQRSTTPQAGPTTPAAGMAAQRPSMFGNGFGGALMRGLLIGGLVGMLMGGGFGGLAGVLGLLVQGLLIALAVMLVLRLLRGRQPQPAGAAAGSGQPSPRSALGGLGGLGAGMGGGAMGGAMGGLGGAPARPAAPAERSDEVGIGPSDYETFERLLGEIQQAYGREDQGALHERLTPEMFSLFADELRENAEKGVRNEVADVKLLQGDLAEAWREGQNEYATVALRYALKDVMRDRSTGQVVSGDAERPQESVELWTFVRPRGGVWRLSAIQEA